MPAKVEELKESARKVLAEARAIADAAEAAGRDFTSDERATIVAKSKEAKGFKDQIDALQGDGDLRKALDDLGTGIEFSPGGAKGSPAQPGQGGTAGERFVKSAEFQSFLKQYPGGRIPDSARGLTMAPVAFEGMKDLAGRGRKDVVTGGGAGSGGALVFPEFLGLQDLGALMRPLRIRALLAGGTTTSDAVEYAREISATNAAVPVPEATASTGTTGTKPESAINLERVTSNVRTIAHWIPATKRALADAGQVRTLIDNWLTYGLEEELENQIVSGDGTGENFEGILHTPGVQAQAFVTDQLVTTRKAKTAVRIGGRAIPTAYVFNPEDNESIDLLRDNIGGPNTGRFLFGDPTGVSIQTLWGLPRIESEALPVGTGLIAAWNLAVLWDREQATIQVSDSHNDFFIRNLVAILGEMRAAFGVLRPKAFCTIDMAA